MILHGQLQNGMQARLFPHNETKFSRTVYTQSRQIRKGFSRGKRRSCGLSVVCYGRIDWKPIEESLKKRVAWPSSPLSSWNYSQVDVVKILGAIQANAFTIYAAVLGTIGFRMSTALGMGWTLIGACVLTTCMGYALCVRQAFVQLSDQNVSSKLDVQRVLMQAQDIAFQSYSYRAEAGSGSKNSALMLVSSLFEPSPVYMLLNCWGLYAIGQCVICKAFGGGLLLAISIASLLAGRYFQLELWKRLAPENQTDGTSEDALTGSQLQSTSARNFFDLLFMPSGTWGIGPVFNGVVWFGALMLPFIEYPASPVVLAPLWTAIGAPALLLLEDIVSLLSRQRRDMKYASSMGPGLQLGSFLVGITCAIAVRSLHMVTFQF